MARENVFRCDVCKKKCNDKFFDIKGNEYDVKENTINQVDEFSIDLCKKCMADIFKNTEKRIA